MHMSSGMRWVLRVGTAITLAFIYIPLIVIAIYAFNQSRSQAWPVDGFTLDWFDRALPAARFFHCLPVRRNVVVTDEVLDSPRSAVVRQAHNRLWAQMAVLHTLLGGSR